MLAFVAGESVSPHLRHHAMVTHADLDTFNRATLRLYTPELDGGTYATNAVAFLRELVPADMYCVGDMDKRAGTLGVDFSDLDPALPRLLDGFARTMSPYPLFNWDPTVNGGRPFFRGDFYSRRQFRDLDVWRESFSLLGWQSHAAMHVLTDDAHVVFIGLERSGPVEYTERDRAVLTRAQHHLANARRLATARGGSRRQKPLDPAEFARAGFSPREAEVLMWLIEGKSNAEMARLLGVHLQTVKFHLTSIFNKAGVGNRLAASLYAIDLADRLRRSGGRKALTARVRA
ncbi:MAG: helix-turn-helix transcriptional regulator [Opitutae bacterium]|nr:helix-turn-helix transcriptional regulator [Opitutae bacterium]